MGVLPMERLQCTNLLLGQGTQATIYKGFLADQPVAVKFYDDTEEGSHAFELEEDILFTMHGSKNICQMIGCAEEHAIIMKQYDCDLFHYVFESAPKSEFEIILLFERVCYGVKNLHNKGIAHLDIKPENILIDTKTSQPYLCDFGSAFKTKKSSKLCSWKNVGTIQYMAPEIGNTNSFDPLAADIFSLGCLLFVIMTGTFPKFDNATLLSLPVGMSSRVSKFITWLVNPNPAHRPSIKQIMRHTLFKKITNNEKAYY